MLLPAKRMSPKNLRSRFDEQFAHTRQAVVLRTLGAILGFALIVAVDFALHISLLPLGIFIFALFPSPKLVRSVFGERATSRMFSALRTAGLGALSAFAFLVGWLNLTQSGGSAGFGIFMFLVAGLSAFRFAMLMISVTLDRRRRIDFRKGEALPNHTPAQRKRAAQFYAEMTGEALRERDMPLAQLGWRNLRELSSQYPEREPLLQMAGTIRDQVKTAIESDQAALREASLCELREIQSQFPQFEDLAGPLAEALAQESHRLVEEGHFADQVPLLEELRDLEHRFPRVLEVGAAYAVTLLGLGWLHATKGQTEKAREFFWEHRTLFERHSAVSLHLRHWAVHFMLTFDGASKEKDEKLVRQLREELEALYRQHPKDAFVNLCFHHCALTDALFAADSATALKLVQAFIRVYRNSETLKTNDSIIDHYDAVVEHWGFTKRELLLPGSTSVLGNER